MTIEMNGQDYGLVIESEEFFSEMSAAHGDAKLRSSFRRDYGLRIGS